MRSCLHSFIGVEFRAVKNRRTERSDSPPTHFAIFAEIPRSLRQTQARIIRQGWTIAERGSCLEWVGAQPQMPPWRSQGDAFLVAAPMVDVRG
jgi:hypothetical protein